MCYITAGNLTKTKIYIFINVLWNTIYWAFLAYFSVTLPLLPLFSVTIIFTVFFSGFCHCFFSFFNFVKPKLSYQHLSENLRKQQLRGILLNMYVFNLIRFSKLSRFLVIFFDIQQTFQRFLHIVVNLIWLCDVQKYQTNVENNIMSLLMAK